MTPTTFARVVPAPGLTGSPSHLIAIATGEQRLADLEVKMLASPDPQIPLTDPDARSKATSGRGSGVVGYTVQVAVETRHHLIVAHEVINDGGDRAQLSAMGKQAKAVLEGDQLEAVADRGYWDSEEILARDQASPSPCPSP